MVILQAFNGAGDTRTPTFINVVGYWLVQIPLAWLLSQYFDFESFGIILAILIAESVLATVSVIVFRKGKWKEVSV